MVAFPMELTVRLHRRWVQVVGPHLIPEPESEAYLSVEVTLPWARRGVLATSLDETTIDELAETLAIGFETRRASPPAPGEVTVALSSQAAAIFLHEAVSHALEADTLAVGGRVEAAIGLRLGPPGLSVLDDPGGAPRGVERRTDDEGRPVERRWLLRDGRIEQPLADAYWAQRSSAVLPGAARRGGRLDPPAPRSSHLVLLPGDATAAELLVGEGLWVPQVTRGRLVVDTGMCRLEAPYGFRFRNGELGEAVGPFTLEGRLAELLDSIEAVGSRQRQTGAGWCAKDHQRLPVWATTPAVRLGRMRVGP
jgi:TldD protein